MKTYNIELPAEFRSGNGVSVEKATITRARMEEILVNAIEADRQRRGAEVKAVVDDLRSHASMARWQAHSLSRLLDAVATQGAQKAATLTAAMSNLERMAMRLEDSADYIDTHAPQPAEPVDKSKNLQGSVVDKAEEMQGQPAEPVKSQHIDDIGVDEFSKEMKSKLRYSRDVKGRGGWKNASAEYLSKLLREHVEKGDPVDVANLAMMLHQNGQRIEPVKADIGITISHTDHPVREEAPSSCSAEAEPVKVPSDADAKHVQDFINCDGMGAMIVEGPQYSAVVRALLARYGNNPGAAHE